MTLRGKLFFWFFLNIILNALTDWLSICQLTYQQPVCWTVWIDIWFNKMWQITLRHSAQRLVGQSEDRDYWISLTTSICNVLRNLFIWGFWASDIINRSWLHYWPRSTNEVMNINLPAILILRAASKRRFSAFKSRCTTWRLWQ